MAQETYVIIVSPVASEPTVGLILDGYYGAAPGSNRLAGQLVAAGTGGQPPVTHRYMGQNAPDAQWLSDMQNATAPAPRGGWPLMDGATELLSEVDAQAAWSAREAFARSGTDEFVLPAETRAAMFSAMGLMLYNPGD